MIVNHNRCNWQPLENYCQPMKQKVKSNLQLNSEQQAVIATRKGHFAILAGPGSGKSECLIQRYNALVSEGENPHEIISLTFTRAAAKNMQNRAATTTMTVGDRPFGFKTFHGIALDFCVQERDTFPFPLAAFPLATGGQVWKFAGDIARRYAGMDVKQLLGWMSKQKRSGTKPDYLVAHAEDIRERVYALAYKEYEERCRKAGILDFDDLLLYMDEILSVYPAVRNRWQYKWVMIDEANDADLVQWRLVQTISQKHGNVFAVGDFNQAIYQWRGAEPELFLKFHEMFPDAKYLYLGTNYRSTQAIVDFIKQIAPVKNELLEKFCSVSEQGEPVAFQGFASPLLEARWVVERIKEINDGKI